MYIVASNIEREDFEFLNNFIITDFAYKNLNPDEKNLYSELKPEMLLKKFQIELLNPLKNKEPFSLVDNIVNKNTDKIIKRLVSNKTGNDEFEEEAVSNVKKLGIFEHNNKRRYGVYQQIDRKAIDAIEEKLKLKKIKKANEEANKALKLKADTGIVFNTNPAFDKNIIYTSDLETAAISSLEDEIKKETVNSYLNYWGTTEQVINMNTTNSVNEIPPTNPEEPF
jgi:hypothetical protein